MKKLVCLLILACLAIGCATTSGNGFSQFSDEELISYYGETKSELSYYESQSEINFGSLQGDLLKGGSMEKANMLSQRLLDIKQEINRRGLELP